MKIVILGNGVAGTNAAREIRKLSDHEILMVSEETLRPFSRTALMYVFMGHLKQENTELYEDWFWAKNRIERRQETVVSLDILEKKIELTDGESISYDKLIIATGSRSRGRARNVPLARSRGHGKVRP
jgi:NADPH-dependent 2,4-dienoyl-CoA reductase/sulfur reductase-like enzyme